MNLGLVIALFKIEKAVGDFPKRPFALSNLCDYFLLRYTTNFNANAPKIKAYVLGIICKYKS